MALFIIGLLVAVVGIGVALFASEGFVKVIGGLAAILVGGGLLFFSSMYTQELGEAKVIKNFDGTIAREDITPGLDFKAPWQDAIDFDILSQQAIYKGDGKSTDTEKVNGGDINAADKNGVATWVDIAVRYSIEPGSVSEIYTQYRNQETFYSRVIDKDIAAVVGETTNKYTTAENRVGRAQFQQTVTDALKARWENKGIKVDSVAVTAINISDEDAKKFSDAQNANTQVIKEEANTRVIQEQAKQRIVAAEGEAEANRKLAQSLTPEILQQRQLDTLKELGAKGNTFVVPNGSNPLIQVEKK